MRLKLHFGYNYLNKQCPDVLIQIVNYVKLNNWQKWLNELRKMNIFEIIKKMAQFDQVWHQIAKKLFTLNFKMNRCS